MFCSFAIAITDSLWYCTLVCRMILIMLFSSILQLVATYLTYYFMVTEIVCHPYYCQCKVVNLVCSGESSLLFFLYLRLH